MAELPAFQSGRSLSAQLAAIIEPRLRALTPGIRMTLALIGPGSDVLGYDSARSMDHDWGPRLTIVVPDADREIVSQLIDQHLNDLLPPTVSGFPTRFSHHPDGALLADEEGTLHRLDVTSFEQIVRGNLLIDSIDELADAVWLSTPMQTLLELTAGPVFHDDDHRLGQLRKTLAFYPDHIWRYQLAGLWMRVAQVQPFIGRAGEVGDAVGSAQIASSISRDLMRIAILQSRQYAPYSKWLGTAFARTAVGREMNAHLQAGMLADDWEAREKGINAGGQVLIRQFNDLKLIPAMSASPHQFHSRPFSILPAEDIAQALKESLSGTALEKLEATMGGIDVITDSTDALKSHEIRMAVREMFDRSGKPS